AGHVGPREPEGSPGASRSRRGRGRRPRAARAAGEEGPAVVAAWKRHARSRRPAAAVLSTATSRRARAQRCARRRRDDVARPAMAAAGKGTRMSEEPPGWAEIILRMSLQRADRESVSRDLLHEDRPSIN